MAQSPVQVAKDELRAVLAEVLEENRLKELEGITYFRLPAVYATPTAGTVVLGTVQPVGPNEGYVWSIRRLTASGLGTGTSPDVLNIYRNGTQGQAIWQLNGNNFGYSFGPTEMLLLAGERLQAASVGSLVSTSQIVLTGDAIEVPRAMIGKLVF